MTARLISYIIWSFVCAHTAESCSCT